MARRRLPLQFNKFTAGLVTDSSPLDYVPNSTLNESNSIINQDGTRSRRKGFDLELGHIIKNTGLAFLNEVDPVSLQFKWKGAGGNSEKDLMVIQVSTHFAIYDLDVIPLSAGLIYEEVLDAENYNRTIGCTSVDSLLVVTSGVKEISVYEFLNDSIIKTVDTLKIRDLFGVQAFGDGLDLTLMENSQYRPTVLTQEHSYNLRNQAFGIPRIDGNNEVLKDPISSFYDLTIKQGTSPFFWGAPSLGLIGSGGVDVKNQTYPSNTDNLLRSFFADANDSDDRTVERFFAKDMYKNPVGTTLAPKGFFIIDALDRGSSRLENIVQLRERYKDLNHPIPSLRTDSTPTGSTVVGQYAGRVWFAGFSSVVVDGDSLSPRMSSYVLFSQQVTNKKDVFRCYQEADPTSHIDNALTDTDGGFIRLDGAYGIKGFAQLGTSLFVFATNGVWRISGTDQTSFSATGYEVSNLYNQGCISAASIVTTDDSIIFWADGAICEVSKDTNREWVVTNIITGSIHTYYNNLTEGDKRTSVGYYDRYDQKILWVHYDTMSERSDSNELIYNIPFKSFTKHSVNCMSNGYPLLASVNSGQTYAASVEEFVITIDGVPVTIDGETVTIRTPIRSGSIKDAVYVVILNSSGTISYSFGTYFEAVEDWSSQGGIDTPAFMEVGPITGGEPRYRKQVPYLTVLSKQTETGFDNNFEPLNPSSCFVQAKWNWSSSVSSGKWTDPREVYRIRKVLTPLDSNDTFDNGESTVTTKNKIRGFGKSVLFRFESRPNKTFHLYGWSFDLTASEEED